MGSLVLNPEAGTLARSMHRLVVVTLVAVALVVGTACTEAPEPPCPEQVLQGDLDLSAPRDEAFHGYTQVAGDLWLAESSAVDVELPVCLRQVSRNIIVHNNAALEGLGGAGQLVEVFGNLSVIGNPTLADLSGLRAVESVGGDVFVEANDALPDIASLRSLRSLGRHLVVSKNTALASLAGLQELAAVPGNMSIRENPQLASLDGLQSITSVGGALEVAKSAGLRDLSGLDGIRHIGAKLTVTSNDHLESLSGLSQLVTIGVDEHTPAARNATPQRGRPPQTNPGLGRHPDDGIAVHCHFNPLLRDLDVLNPIMAGHLVSVIGNLAITSNDGLSACHVQHLGHVLETFSWAGSTRETNNLDCSEPNICHGTSCQ